MNDDSPDLELLRNDSRYPIEAYEFVQQALKYAEDYGELELTSYPSEIVNEYGDPLIEKHLTGQQFCEAIRRYAVNQFGYMAKLVLKTWNIDCTSCFGDLVYNMIDVGLMKKSEHDRREDFDDVYRFDDVFENSVEISSSTALL